MASLNFTGSGQYNELDIVKSTSDHSSYLQHTLRNTDLRECMIAGATPWRALHLPLSIKGAETYTVLSDEKPICMFGTVPIDNEEATIASIWLLGSYDLNDHKRTWMRLTHPVFDYFQEKYDILENVVPIDHEKTIRWLQFAGCLFSNTATVVNGYPVARFVRCAYDIEVSFEEDERPISN